MTEFLTEDHKQGQLPLKLGRNFGVNQFIYQIVNTVGRDSYRHWQLSMAEYKMFKGNVIDIVDHMEVESKYVITQILCK